MLTRSVMLATTLTVGLVAGVGSSALAAAFVPGNESGSVQQVEAIADGAQDPSEGTSSSFLNGVPTIVTLPTSIAIDGKGGAEPDAETASEIPTSEPGPAPEPSESAAPTGNGSSETTAEDKAAEEQAKKDKKAAEEQAKKDKKAAEQALKDQAKEDKKAEKDAEDSDDTPEDSPQAT